MTRGGRDDVTDTLRAWEEWSMLGGQSGGSRRCTSGKRAVLDVGL